MAGDGFSHALLPVFTARVRFVADICHAFQLTELPLQFAGIYLPLDAATTLTNENSDAAVLMQV
jgi:hypothetical protein